LPADLTDRALNLHHPAILPTPAPSLVDKRHHRTSVFQAPSGVFRADRCQRLTPKSRQRERQIASPGRNGVPAVRCCQEKPRDAQVAISITEAVTALQEYLSMRRGMREHGE